MKKNKSLNWQMILIIILGILLVSVTIFSIGKEKDTLLNQEPQKVYVGYESGEVLDNFSKEDAVYAMKDILLSIDNDIDGESRSIEERMEVLDDSESDIEDVINKRTIEMLYLQEEFEDVKFNRQFTASALLTYRQLIKEVTREETIEPLIDAYDEIVYLDNKLMRANIPLDIFIGENKGVAFELQYIEGEWKFNPYTSMMSLLTIVNYESQMNEDSSE